MTDDTDSWNICKKCGKAYEEWSYNGNTTSRCLDCASPESRRRHGAAPRKRKCALCEKEFIVPENLGATTKYCIEHRGMDTYERINAFKQKKGQYKPRFKPKEKEVDNRRYVNIVSLMSNRSIEKIVKALNDRKVVLIK